MIYLISDVHGEYNFPGFDEYLKIAGADDLLLILGDVGLNFDETEENKLFTKKLLKADKKIAFIDGNHENFAYINSFPEETFNGGKVHRLSQNVFHLKRGNIYNIEGKSFFVFGGCRSSQKWKNSGKPWYFGEEPEEDEISLAYESLKSAGNCVDYILTHKYEKLPEDATTTKPLLELCQYIEENVSYIHWYCGHDHEFVHTDDKHTTVYDTLIHI